MSKEKFSKKISEIMTEKMLYLDNLAYDIFFKKDDYFELVLCLSYMTLSKEKIIKKDMNNTNRLQRLTRMVSEDDIEKVFDHKYFSSLPNIIYSKENDKTWILDNIRDSIMHGSFDIDEEKQCFLINNKQYDRELIAEIPFKWFIEYSKYDILSKKLADKYTVKGFYYNKDKDNRTYLQTKKEVINNILYHVKITGNNFNIQEVETRIRDLFNQYSMEEIDETQISLYQERIDSERIKYNPKYLTSFYIASKKVEETIKKEYPNLNIQIYIDNRKGRLVNKLTKQLPKHYKNYKVMYNELNNSINHKSTSSLKRISTIIENLDKIPEDYQELNIYQIMDRFNTIIQGEPIEYTDKYDIYTCFNNNLKLLKEICLNVYGLSTLVINQESLYNTYFLNKEPSEYGINVCTKQKYLDYVKEEKKIRMSMLDVEISLDEKTKQLTNCTDEKGINHLNNEIKTLKESYEKLKKALEELPETLKFRPYFDYNKADRKLIDDIEGEINYYREHLFKANNKKDKLKIKKIISKTITKKYEEQAKFTYGYCTTMKEALTVIRNSFSHIGRTNINNKNKQICYLIDYDNNQEQSGFVITEYRNLIDLLSMPLYEESKTKTK